MSISPPRVPNVTTISLSVIPDRRGEKRKDET